MKKFLLLMLVVWTGIASSCKYDDDELWGSVDDLANRISAMETLTQQMNGDIAAMQAIVTAVENQVAVSEVEKLTDGYILHFTNGQTATIKNGTDGKDGKDAPAVGLDKEGGVYYWTLTVDGKTEWLTDEAGNKIAVANDPGAAGSAGRTPSLKVDKDGYWMVSYDGTNFDYIEDANGHKVNAWGTNGVAQFKEPKVSKDEESITIVMADGTEYVLPLLKALTFYDANNKEIDIKNIEWDGTQKVFEYTYKLKLEGASHEIYDESGVDVNISMADNKATLDLGSNQSVSDARAVVLFYNESQTLTAVFKFKTAPWDGQKASPALVSLGDEGQGETLGIATAADLKRFAYMINGNEPSTQGRAATTDNESYEGVTFKLLNDIDLSNHSWEPIGMTRESAFKGTFDGNGKTIKGLKVVNIGTDESGITTGAGLFGVVEDAIVKGLTVTDAKVELTSDGVEAAGLIVGRAYGSVTLEDIIVEKETTTGEADVNGAAQNVGSIAGYIESSNVTIKGCEVKSASLTASSTDGTASGDKVAVGGVVGTLNIINDGSGKANLNIEGNKVGGVDLSTSTEGNTSTSAGGVVGVLKVDDTVNLTQNISGNTVSDTKTEAPSDEDTPSTGESTATQTQGPVIGNMSELDPEISAGIIKDNTVGEDVKVETQLTVQNLGVVLDQALAESGVNTFTIKGTIEQAVEVEIPASGVDVTLNFDALATTSTNVLTIKQGEATVAGESTHKLTINMPTTDGGQYLTIQAPETTVTLASGNYAVVTALTAQNTLVVEKGVTIDRLEVEDGGVDVYGHVKNLVRKEGYTENVILTIKDGGKVDSIGNGFELIEGNPGAHELALKEAAKNGGSFTVTENLRLTSPLIVSSNFTLNFSNGAFWGDNGQFVDSKGWKAMVVVMPGATFTYNGGGEFNTGHVLTQLSCIRMVGGSDAPSKVIMNDGNLIGTYHAILIDEDCQNAEVEINGGTLSCDWWNEFHGVNIFNKSDAKITIKGGNLTTFTDTKISCIEMWGGELNISGGQFDTNLTNVQEGLNVNPNVGNTLIGPAIAIAPKSDVTVNISGGTFTGNGSSSFMEKIVDNNLLGKVNVNLSITGGEFNAPVTSQNCQGFISGGKFKVQPKDIYLVEGKSTSLKGDYFEIVESVPSDGSATGNNFGNGGIF